VHMLDCDPHECRAAHKKRVGINILPNKPSSLFYSPPTRSNIFPKMPSANSSQLFNGNVPLIDFSKYTEGSLSEKTKCRDLFAHSLATHGFARLINCGVKDSNVERAFNFVRSTSLQ